MTSSSDHVVDGFIDALLDDDPTVLYERAPCGYLSTTPDGTIIKVNETFLALSGRSRDELVGHRQFVDLLSAGGRIYHETHYAPMLRMQGSAREIALDLVRADGSRLPVLVNSVLERDSSGAPSVIRTAVFDATQRREYERELLREKERAEVSEARATALARTLQQTLIPPTPPVIPHLDVAARYRPAGDGTEVGGDFYDVFQTAADDWVVVIGDVCGKGAEAAVITALARYTIRAATVEESSPAHALRVLNDVLLQHETTRFCTVALLRLHRRNGTWQARLATAGHPQPLHRRADGTVIAVGTPGSLLGVLSDPEVPETELTLVASDLLLLHTDGVTDARRGAAFYDDARVLEWVRRPWRDADELSDALLEDVLEFQNGSARDDIAILTVRVPAGG